MDILYRRFFLVAALITAFGSLTANLILETRNINDHDVLRPAISISCKSQKLCVNMPTGKSVMAFAALG